VKRFLFSFLVVLLCLGLNAQGLKEAPVLLKPAELGVGRQMSNATFLCLDGKVRALSDVVGQTALVIVFTSESCPVAKKFSPDVAALQKKFEGKKITWLLVNPFESDDIASFKKRMTAASGLAGLVIDSNQILAKTLGARTSTEVFVLDNRRTLLYRGALSDQYGLAYQLEKPTHTYLESALGSLLKGELPMIQATSAPGCALETAVRFMPEASALTYHERISRIVMQNCLDCHRTGGVAPFALETMAQVLDHASMIRKVIAEGRMPPWFASPSPSTQHRWGNDRTLTESDKRDLLAWLDLKTEGPKSEAPVPLKTLSSEWFIGKPDIVYELTKPIKIKASGKMPYQHVFVKTTFTEKKWVKAWEVLPTSREVVHHVLIFAIPAAEANPESLKKKARGGEMGGFFAAYVPGNSYLKYADDLAIGLEPGTVLYFQIHYTPIGTEQEDRTKLGLIFSDKPPVHEVSVASIVNQKILIPPGEAAHPESAELKVPADVVILGYTPHMHIRGKAFTYEAVKGNQTNKLLEVPVYDFNWQLSYRYAEPLVVEQGSTLRALAVYDNSAANPANPDPTKTVKWGSQSDDEMMIGYIEYYFLHPNTSAKLNSKPSAEIGKESTVSENVDRTKELMKTLDLDGDGKITKEEILKNQNGKTYLKYFEEIDADGNGVITEAELKTGLEKLRK
jgi:peroxiredoxin